MTVDPLNAVIIRLNADAAIIAALGGAYIYRKGKVPKTQAMPYVISSYVDDLDKDDSNTSTYGQARVQCSSYAATDQEAFKISKLIKKSLHNVTNRNLSGVNISSIVDMGAVPDSNPDIPVYLYHRDFMVKYLDI